MPETGSARDAALHVLSSWRLGRGRPESLLKKSFDRFHLDPRDRGLAMELVYGVLRNLISLDYILSRFMSRPIDEVSPDVADTLRIAAYQVMYLDRIPHRAAVNEAVEQAKRAEGRGAGGFVNAVLRALISGWRGVEYPDFNADPVKHLAVKYSYPDWLARRWVGRFGADEAGSLMAAGNIAPPVTLRVNTLKNSRETLMALMVETGVSCEQTSYSEVGLKLSGGPPVHELPGYGEGLFAVQDEAAQLVSMLLSPQPGEVLLDACAAPGGKTGHIAEISGGGARLVALDIGLDKLRLLKENINRLGTPGVKVACADSAVPLPLKAVFDRAILDAPCTGLGVIRRRPEIKYVRSEADIARLAALQGRMLRNIAGYVKSGGTVVYSTCSTEPDEGEKVVESFLAGDDRFVLENAGDFLPEGARMLVTEKGYLRTYPHRHGTDGFFVARLRRVS